MNFHGTHSPDRSSTEPEPHQLPASNHPMLAVRELRDRRVNSLASSANRIFCTYGMHNFRFAAHAPMVAARLRPVGPRA